jgi:membrane-associated phospholipid phosphatase
MKVFLAALCILFSLDVSAQSPVLNNQISTPVFTATADTSARATVSTYQDHPKKISPALKIGATVAAGAGLWLTTYALGDEPLQKFSQSHRTDLADHVSVVAEYMGHQKTYLPFAGAALAAGLLIRKPKLKEVGILTLASLGANALATSTLKNTLHRHRPCTTTNNRLFDGLVKEKDNTSMPSSHTSTAFAVATSIATVYGDEHKFVRPLVYGAASLVGLSRINDNAHWTSDVLAGAAVGYLSAKAVGYVYRLTEDKLRSRNQRLQITPQVGYRSAALSTTLVF